MNRTVIKTKDAPSAVGAYNQGITANGLIYTAGQIPLDPKTNKLVDGGIETKLTKSLKTLMLFVNPVVVHWAML